MSIVIGHYAYALHQDSPLQVSVYDREKDRVVYWISFNREIIIMAFECPHCGFRNNELQSAGAFNEKAQTVTCKVSGKEVSREKKCSWTCKS